MNIYVGRYDGFVYIACIDNYNSFARVKKLFGYLHNYAYAYTNFITCF